MTATASSESLTNTPVFTRFCIARKELNHPAKSLR